VVDGLDLSRKEMSNEEGFLFSRIDGQTSLEEIVRASGMAQGAALGILTSLQAKGIITWDGAAAVPEDDGRPPWERMQFDPFDLAEDVDLDETIKKKILYLHAKMGELTHYKILGIGRRSEPKEIKRAYFQVSREFHPDTYFRKNLGSYKSRIEAIFKRVGQAYEVLAEEQKRTAYDATLPYEPTAEELEEKRKAQERRVKDERLAEERRQRLLKRSPLAARKAKARKHFKDAQVAMEENNAVAASNSLKLALALDGDNEEYKKALAKVGPEASKIRSEKEYRRAKAAEAMGRYQEALEAYLYAIENNPDEVRALGRAAELLMELNLDLRKALTFARKAQNIEPDEPEHMLTLSRIYEALDMYKNAVRELTRYVQLNPLDERASERLQEMKKKSR
jgi:curved DNA-binding protein CbpA